MCIDLYVYFPEMVSLTSQYALRAVLYLATVGGGPVVAEDISKNTGVPKGYLHKILRRLGKAGILDAQRGVGGGYVLSQKPAEITVCQVLKAIEPQQPDFSFDPCKSCSDQTVVSDAIGSLMKSAQSHIERIFTETSIADLLDSDSGSQRAQIPA
ncbi:MAG: hypothetical protein Phyf2KO_09450 [Phycisphaerales bacterium]